MLVEDGTSLSNELALIDVSKVGTSYCFACARDSHVVLMIVASGYTAKRLACKYTDKISISTHVYQRCLTGCCFEDSEIYSL